MPLGLFGPYYCGQQNAVWQKHIEVKNNMYRFQINYYLRYPGEMFTKAIKHKN